MKTTAARNVIILKNLNSPEIEQAVFILKKGWNDDMLMERDIVIEAQRIIDDFISKRKKMRKKGSGTKAVLILTPIFAAITLFSYLFLRMA